MSAVSSHPRRNPQTSFRKVGEEGGLVVIPGRAEVKVLNPVGIAIYPLLDGSHSKEEIAARIAEEFEVSLDEARNDLEAFLEELNEHGMLAQAETA